MPEKIEKVEDLIKVLQTMNPKSPIFGEVYMSCMTDAGSDAGGDELRKIDAVYNFDTRVVLKLDYSEVRIKNGKVV